MAVSLAGEVAGSLVSGMLGWSKDLSVMQQQYNYNRPQTQMADMVAAGINPNYAAANVSGAQVSAVSNPFPDLGRAFGEGYANMISENLAAAQADNQRSEASMHKAEEDEIRQNIKWNDETWEDRKNEQKARATWTEYEAEVLRPYAEQTEQFAKANFDKLTEEANQIRKQVEEIDEQIKNLGKQRELWDSEIGVNASTKRYQDSLTALNRQKKELIDRLGGETVEQAYELAIVEGDTKKAKAMRDGIEKYNKAVAKGESEGATEGTPQGRLKQQYLDEMNEKLSDIDSQIEYFKSRGMRWTIRKLERERSRIQREYRNKMRRVDRGFAAGANFAGYGLNAGG